MKNNQTNKARLFAFKNFIYDFVKVTAAIPTFIMCRPKYLYSSKEAKKRIRGGAIAIANHNGFFDPIALMAAIWYRRHHFVCLKQFFEGKSAWWFKQFGCIPIDKDNLDMESFRNIVSHLNSGELVTMFPEGHISDGSDRIDVFKSGVVLMAVRSRKPIVPVYLKPRKHWYNRCVFAIGEAVDVNSLGQKQTFSQIDAFAETLRDKEKELEALANIK
ncbi:MAG: 1-acyl-sn-glycerol-3-phosphate acyltransferase [Ruminococcus sp.]|nr:1-acyl-sn-glycerol-3-phosphate acyltransferase [Ruminococcus sp.]